MPEFHPTPAMRRLANVLLGGELALEPQARCAAARISPSTYNSLMANEDFLGWLNDRARQHVTDRLWQVRIEHLRLTLEGNLQAIKLFYDRYDPCPPGGNDSDSGDSVAKAFANLAKLAAETPMEDWHEE